ncbi:hypothetical protein [Bradyrhizobium sp. USDA 4529]
MKEVAAISDAAMLRATEEIMSGVREADVVAEHVRTLSRSTLQLTFTGPKKPFKVVHTSILNFPGLAMATQPRSLARSQSARPPIICVARIAGLRLTTRVNLG